MSDPLPTDLAAALQATESRRGVVGRSVHYFREVGSTNDVAARLAERGAPDGTVVVASAQSAGRGRRGRIWYSVPGAGLYVSVVCRNIGVVPQLTLAGGVAVAEGIRSATGLPVEIKWPNDIVAGTGAVAGRRRKVAGVLAEASSDGEALEYVVLGFGVNVRRAAYPPDLADIATSIESELGQPVDPGPLFGETLAALADQIRRLASGDLARMLARWRELAPSVFGSHVEWDTPSGAVSGTTGGIADDGALLVRNGDRLERIISGEIRWRT